MKIRTWRMLCCLLVLAMGAVARAQAVEDFRLSPEQLMFPNDGKKLFATFYDIKRKVRRMQAWDVASGRLLSQAVLPNEYRLPSFFSVFSPDGRLYAYSPIRFKSSMLETPTTIRDTATGALVSTPQMPEERAMVMEFSPDNKLLIGLSNQQLNKNKRPAQTVTRMDVWDTATGKPLSLFQDVEENERVSKTLFSQDNRVLVRLGWKINPQGRVQQWAVVFDRVTGKKMGSCFLADEGLGEFSLSPDEDDLWESEYSPSPNRWDRWRFELSPNGRTLAGVPTWEVAMKTPTIVALWDTQTGALARLLPLKADPHTSISLHFSSDGSQLTAFGSNQGAAYSPPITGFWRQSWETATGQELTSTRLPIKAAYIVNGLRSIPPVSGTNGRFFARFTEHNTIEIFSVESGKLVREIEVELRF